MAEPVLVLKDIKKSFDGVPVLHGVDLEILPGEVHSLVGENGAGKSTLMKIAAGIHSPDSGQITFNGHVATLKNTADAKRLGIAMVHQELSLAPDVSVAENILIGSASSSGGWFIDWRKLNSVAAELLGEFGLAVDPSAPVSSLKPGYRQVVEILKALAADPKIIIFDEPTSSLEAHETALVLETVEKLRERSIGVVYISHRMDEIFRISDRITVLRDGNLICTWNANDVTREQVINSMVGREMTEIYPSKAAGVEDELLRVDNLTRSGAFRDVSFVLRRGEILGFSGLVGSGRTEVMRAVFGADPIDSGSLYMEGNPKRLMTVRDAMDAGIAYLPEERKTQGLFLERSLEDNILCGNLKRCSRGLLMQSTLSRSLSTEYCQKLSIKARDISQEVKSLSGGNQQKVMLARWMAACPKVLIVDEPTRGVDIGAKAEIHRMLRDYADSGNGVIVVSSEMPEIIGFCDRIIVLHEGALAGEVPGIGATEEQLIALAVG